MPRPTNLKGVSEPATRAQDACTSTTTVCFLPKACAPPPTP
jgi:hypothetical protein